MDRRFKSSGALHFRRIMVWANRLVMLMSIECLTASAVFAYNHNWKLAGYWFFAGCINGILSFF